MRSPEGLIVEHYRLDPSAALRRTLGLGSLIVTLGAIVMAIAIVVPRLDAERPVYARAAPMSAADAAFRSGAVTRDGVPIEPEAGWEMALAAVGLACIVIGGLLAILGLRRVLSEESYLALSTDGAIFRAGKERSTVRWDEIEDVRWDAACGVCFERHDGTVWVRAERFAGVDGATLAARAREVRRKALFGLLG